MIKFVSVLFSVMSLNLTLPFVTDSKNQQKEIDFNFSNKALGFESGQPVFSKNTKIIVSKSTDETIKLFINEEERDLNSDKIEFVNLKVGTYTIVAKSNEDGKSIATVGFTIQ